MLLYKYFEHLNFQNVRKLIIFLFFLQEEHLFLLPFVSTILHFGVTLWDGWLLYIYMVI
jgi:hypothetical protein